MTELSELGYNENLARYRQEQSLSSFEVGRISAEHRERYTVISEQGELEAEIIGHLRFAARDRSDFPAVGDWVAISVFNKEEAIIHAIYPRHSILERQAVGKFAEKQIIATNIDQALIIQAVDRDFNLNRLERYLSVAYAGKIDPVIILSKIDLVDPALLADLLKQVSDRIRDVRVLAISNLTGKGVEAVISLIEEGKTYCLLGSSGVGKSTLVNRLTGREEMTTKSISDSTNKGRHATTHRALFVLENGGVLIDNPGMREIGLTDREGGLESTFHQIADLSEKCRFSDCKHLHESDCAVRDAVDNGELDRAVYENYLKMEREKIHFHSSVAEKRRKDKEFGKMVKAFKKNKEQNKP